MQIKEILTAQAVDKIEQLPDVSLSSTDTIMRYVSAQPKWNALKVANVCDPIPLSTFGSTSEYDKPHAYISHLWIAAIKTIGNMGKHPTRTQIEILVSANKGWTVNMWRDFFFRCTTLEFATEFQNIQTHGLSYAFVSSWAKVYNDTIRMEAMLQHQQQQAAKEREAERKNDVINEALNHVPEVKTSFQLFILQCDALAEQDRNTDSLKKRYKALDGDDFVADLNKPFVNQIKAAINDLFPARIALRKLGAMATYTERCEWIKKIGGFVPTHYTTYCDNLKISYDIQRASSHVGYFRKQYEQSQTPFALSINEAKSLTLKELI